MKFAGWMAAVAALAAAGYVQAEISLEEAARIALSETGGGRITEIARGWEDGERAWEVEVVRNGEEHEVAIHLETGSVIQVEPKGKISSSKERRLSEATLPAPQALDRALAHTGGGRVLKMDLDREGDVTTYEFDIDVNGRKEEVDIDAATGAVVEPASWFAFFGLRSDRGTGTTRRTEPTYRRDIYGYESPRDHRFDRYDNDWRYERDYYRDDGYWRD